MYSIIHPDVSICIQVEASDWNRGSLQSYPLHQAMFRVIKESETVDERQHCFLMQTVGRDSRYFSMETRQDLLRLESAWHRAICHAVSSMRVSVTRSGNKSQNWLFWRYYWQKKLDISLWRVTFWENIYFEVWQLLGKAEIANSETVIECQHCFLMQTVCRQIFQISFNGNLVGSATLEERLAPHNLPRF